MTAVILAVGLAFTGYLATYLNGMRLEQRKQRLSRVNLQLSDCYGPLLALTEANRRVFDAFVARHARPGGVSIFQDATPPTAGELEEWRLWVTTVFLPNVQAMRDVIVAHTDLLLDAEMPALLLDLCAHVSGYEITVARWALGDHAEHQSVVPFPGDEVRVYARTAFSRLQAEQARLLGRRLLRPDDEIGAKRKTISRD